MKHIIIILGEEALERFSSIQLRDDVELIIMDELKYSKMEIKAEYIDFEPISAAVNNIIPERGVIPDKYQPKYRR